MIRTCTFIVGFTLATTTLAAQATTPAVPTEEQVRQWAEDAASQAAGGKNGYIRMSAYVRSFRKLVKSALPDYDASYVSVYDQNSAGGLGQYPSWPVAHFEGGITIGLVGPLASFEEQSALAILDGHSLEAVGWLAGPAVVVLPHGAYALDIVKVLVESDGAVVAPLDASQYAAPSMAQWLGKDGGGHYQLRSAMVNLHGGHIVYPSSAFATRRSVKVTVISSTGWTRAKSLSAKDLRKLW
jgi:hypothetical protein